MGTLKQPHLLARTKEFDLLCYWAIAVAVIAFVWLYLYRHSYAYHASTGWHLYSIWAASHLGAGKTDFLMSYRPGYMLNVPLVQWFHVSFYGLRVAMGVLLLLATLCLLWGLGRLDWTRASLPLGLAITVSCTGYFTSYLINYYTVVSLFLMFGFGLWMASERQVRPVWRYCYAVLAGAAIAVASWGNFSVIVAGMVVSMLLATRSDHHRAGLALIIGFYVVLALLLLEYFGWFGVWHQYQEVMRSAVMNHKIARQGWGNELVVRTIYLFGYTGMMLVGPAVALVVWAVIKVSKATERVRWLPLFLWLMPLVVITRWVAVGSGSHEVDALYYGIIVSAGFSITLLLLWGAQDYGNRGLKQIRYCLLSLLIFYLFQRANSQSHFGHMAYLYLGVAFVLILPVVLQFVRSRWLRALVFSNFLLLGIVVPLVGNSYVAISTTRYVPVWANQVMVEKLGVYVNEPQARVWYLLDRRYRQYQCESKYFISFYDAPMIYYLMGRAAPFNQAWLSKMDFYPTDVAINSERVIAALQQHQHWCVVYSDSIHGGLDPHNATWLKAAYDYIDQHSAKRIKLGYQPLREKTYWLYVN